MRVCLLGRSDLTTHPAASVLARRLARAGHEVAVVCGDGRASLEGVDVVAVPRRRPQGLGRIGWLARRAQPAGFVESRFTSRLVKAAAAAEADIVYPAGPTDVEMARSAVAAAGRGAVMTQPHWKTAGRNDLAWVAYDDVTLISSAAGPGLPFLPTATAPGARTATVAIAYRRTGTNPGHYLESALQRLGVDVVPLDHLDWEAARGADAVVIVESPLPRLEQRGTNPGIPVLYWVHHGEHHVEANVRLARHYQADAVLMAHSLHLAHRFSVPVHRFPFGIAPELGTEFIPFAVRRHDVALIGSGTESVGGRYTRRAALVEAARSVTDAVVAGRGYSPHELVDLYRDTRIVINDGGDRHFPITMRVFESTGAGALLLTDPAPGLPDIYQPGRHHVEIGDDFRGQVRDLLADPTTEDIARAGHDHGLAHHLYDHRAMRLLDIMESTTRRHHAQLPFSELESVLDADPDIEIVANAPEPLIDHVVDPRALSEIPDNGVQAVYVGDPGDLAEAVRAARIFVYGPNAVLSEGEPVSEHYRRLDVRPDPRLPNTIGGVSYRIPRSP